MDGLEIAVLVAASYLAVTGLLRMMLARQRELEAGQPKTPAAHGNGASPADGTASPGTQEPSQAAA